MTRKSGPTLARLLATLALILQMILPGSVAVAEARGIDLTRYMCGPAGELSPAARSGAMLIARLLDPQLPDQQPLEGSCALCMLSHGAPIPEPTVVIEPVRFPAAQAFEILELGLVRPAQGPPVGSRGPPAHI